MIGFMGCYAGINALKSAHHIVRSVPEARVLILNLELCSLHFQETHELEQVLSFLVFADGCAASLVSAEPDGLAIDSFLALSIPETSHLITWRIGELGFDMHLSGKVPGEIGSALKQMGTQVTRGADPQAIDLYNQLAAKPSETVSTSVAQLDLANLYAASGKQDQARALWAKVKDADKDGAAGSIATQKLAAKQ